MSVSDIFGTVYTGATFNIVPKSYFSFPIQLINYLNEREVNTIYWVPSALCIVANLKLFDYTKPKYLKKVSRRYGVEIETKSQSKPRMKQNQKYVLDDYDIAA